MARLLKQRYTYKGVTKQTVKWYVEYRTGTGDVVRVPGFKSKPLTERLARQLEEDAERGRAGLPVAAPPATAKKLHDLLAAFREQALARAGAEYVGVVVGRVEKVLRGTGWVYPRDMSPEPLEAYLSRRRTGAEKMSAQTWKHYLRAVGQFARWLVRKGEIPRDPVQGLQAPDVGGDRRRVRRAEAPGFLDRLFASVRVSTRTHAHRKGKDRRRVTFHLTGPDREMLYLTAAMTGLRSGELAALTPESFDLAAPEPFVLTRAAASKNRRTVALPLHPGLLARLRAWVAGRPAGEKLWPRYERRWAVMLAADLEDAGLVVTDAHGEVYDFHALRHQFVTDLARAGVPLQQAQKLARHSSPSLTSNVYTRASLTDLAAAVARLPGPHPSPPESGPPASGPPSGPATAPS